jgi:hypothetical protein
MHRCLQFHVFQYPHVHALKRHPTEGWHLRTLTHTWGLGTYTQYGTSTLQKTPRYLYHQHKSNHAMTSQAQRPTMPCPVGARPTITQTFQDYACSIKPLHRASRMLQDRAGNGRQKSGSGGSKRNMLPISFCCQLSRHLSPRPVSQRRFFPHCGEICRTVQIMQGCDLL